jgi:hypothetical protein
VIYIIKEVEKSCQEFGLTQCSLETISKNEDCLNSNNEVQLWPVQELMCIFLSGALKRALMNSMTVWQQNEISNDYIALATPYISFQDIAKHLSSIMLSLPSIPPVLVSMITFLSAKNEVLTDFTADGFKNLIQKLIMMILQHSELSPSVRQVKDWLSWKQKSFSIENSENEMEVKCIGDENTRKVRSILKITELYTHSSLLVEFC